MLEARFAASVLDHDAAHRLGSGGEEVSAVVPRLGRVVAGETQVRFVYQGGRVERLAGFLAGELPRRQLAQFVVDQRQELVRGVGLAPLDLTEDAGHLTHAGHCTPRPRLPHVRQFPRTP